MMKLIHEFMDLPLDFRLRECGTQEYEADVVTLEQRGENIVLFYKSYEPSARVNTFAFVTG